jgi:uncharacterized membrane protein
MLTNQQRAMGIFPTYSEAQDALNALQHSGFAMNQVSIIAKESDQLQYDNQHSDVTVKTVTDTTRVEDGAKTGGTTGGAVGGITGLLVGLGTLAIPGVGPIMLAGAAATAIATTLAGGAIGAATGGLLGGLIGLGIPEDRAQAYNDHVVNGQYLLIVDGTSHEILQAGELLEARGVREWEIYGVDSSGKYVPSSEMRTPA